MSGNTFTDRKKETEKLVSNFNYGVNTFMVSPRRWGKTSLVKKVKELTENDNLKVVYVDVQRCRNKEEFCERVASAVLTQTSNSFKLNCDSFGSTTNTPPIVCSEAEST